MRYSRYYAIFVNPVREEVRDLCLLADEWRRLLQRYVVKLSEHEAKSSLVYPSSETISARLTYRASSFISRAC
jgi:hypothetical protein